MANRKKSSEFSLALFTMLSVSSRSSRLTTVKFDPAIAQRLTAKILLVNHFLYLFRLPPDPHPFDLNSAIVTDVIREDVS